MHPQLEDIGASIMARDIQHPFRATHQTWVDLPIENLLLLAQRTGDIVTVGVDNGAVANIDPVTRIRIEAPLEFVGVGNIIFAQRHAAAYDIHAALLGDMTDGGKPGLAAIPRRRDIDLRAPGVERVASQGHVVFPANEAAEPAKWRIVDGERAPIALCPDDPLPAGRDELAMLAEQVAFGINVD